MGKMDQKQSKKRSCKATSKSKHKATDGDSEHKKQPSFDATKFEATNDDCPQHARWCDQFQQLCEFKVQFGHCIVPKQYYANPKLGTWVSTQRNVYRAAYRRNMAENSTFMTAEHIRALVRIGFDWGTTKTDLASIWNERFQELREFKEHFGTCLVPQLYAANPQLGQWVANQRRNYRKITEENQSPITAERIRALVGIGFSWGTRKTDWASIWNARFQELREFKAQFGHWHVPSRYSANPKLGQWVAHQRYNSKTYHEGKPSLMTPERIRALDGIGFNEGTTKTTAAFRSEPSVV